jgi:hypothetical protein
MSELTDTATRFKAALDRQDMAALSRIVEAYGSLVNRLRGDIDSLAEEIAQMQDPTGLKIKRLERYRRLLNNSIDEIEKYQGFLGVEVGGFGRTMIDRGLAESRQLIAAAYGDKRILGMLRDLPPESVRQLLGFLDTGGPLYKRIAELAPTTADRIAETILQSIAMGQNPRKLAAEIVSKALGMGLTDSLRMARTVQLWTYREATRANYIANSDVVKGWVWFAELDTKTCMSCVAMHGTVHPLDETLNDHHNGRCAMIPITITNKNPIEQTGIDWFEKQSDSKQSQMMGEGRYTAWKDGKFELDKLTTTRENDVYGAMRTEATLKELLA